ncbi:MAG: 16S rRNA (guanine(966)-N(2))-methyltransferase RsmD [Candidatus Cloacimonadota bacterium]|nr:MAG: 16S rRNA (guanine(966)-N(2))-methyltransferase RsmD [Candidatus Cloacimonadota bacterium]
MRVIGGSAKKQKLITGYETVRPTSDTIKETLFNLLGDLKQTYFLDLFAGTGNIGIEALSRGAASAIFVEKSVSLCKIIRQNLKLTHFDEKSSVLRREVTKSLFENFLDKCFIFDIVFADPPYEKGMIKKLFECFDNSIISNDGVLIVQHSIREKPLRKPSRELKIGDTNLSFFESKLKQ